jgi:hypothetical protein
MLGRVVGSQPWFRSRDKPLRRPYDHAVQPVVRSGGLPERSDRPDGAASRAAPPGSRSSAGPRLAAPSPLAVLAEAALLGMSDVAFLARMPKSTLSRLWHDPTWLDVVSGANLQRLITAVPGLTAYVESRGQTARLEAALQMCTESGLEVRTPQLLNMVRSGPGVQHLATVLEAAAAVMRMEIRDSIAGLSRCWGLPQSQVLDAVFALAPDVALVAQPQVLTDRAMQMVDRVETVNSIRPTIGIGILLHKLTRATGEVPDTVALGNTNRHSAFAYRSGIIGMILGNGDLDTAIGYHRHLQIDPLLQRNELWSLVTFGGDSALTPDLGSAGRTALHRTAPEVVRDVATQPEAYLHYLVTSAIPVLLEYDRSFGSSVIALRHAVGRRLELGVESARTRAAMLRLISYTAST